MKIDDDVLANFSREIRGITVDKAEQQALQPLPDYLFATALFNAAIAARLEGLTAENFLRLAYEFYNSVDLAPKADTN
jgi:hypothetical protein